MARRRRFLDPSFFTDPEEALDIFDNSIRESISYDALVGPVFYATVLNPPIPLSAEQISAILGAGATGEANAKRLTKFVFKGRIEELHGDFLDMPCDLATAPNEFMANKARRLISQHTEFVGTTDGPMPFKGDIVKVELSRSPTGAWDLQYGKYIGMHEDGGAPPDRRQACLEAKSAFDTQFEQATQDSIDEFLVGGCFWTDTSEDCVGDIDADLTEADATEPVTSIPDGAGMIRGLPAQDIFDCAVKYDALVSTTGSMGKEMGASHRWVTANNSKIGQLHKTYQPYVKCFIHNVWEEKDMFIHINSAYRSVAKQNQMRADWEKDKAAGVPDIGARPSVGGSSHHNFGFAVDFNPIDRATFAVWVSSYNEAEKAERAKGKSGRGATDKEKAEREKGRAKAREMSQKRWKDTGVPKIAEDIGIRWGGKFTSNYDPIHVDLGDLINKLPSEIQAMVKEQGVDDNAVELA